MIAALARLSSRRTRSVLVGAALVFLAAAALGGPVVSILKSEHSDFQDPNAPNQQVLRIIESATGQTAGFGLVALVQSRRDVRLDAAAQRESSRIAALLSSQAGFQRAIDYPATHLPQLLSRDGRQALVLAAFATREQASAAVVHVRARLAGSGAQLAGSGAQLVGSGARLARSGARLAGSDVRFGGNDVAFDEIDKRTSSDLERAELFAFPILLLLSFWVFRGLVAAALPLLVGGFAIVVTFLALRLIDQLLGLSIFAVNLVTGMGLGLGIDYSLFVLARYREELARGAESRTAILNTLQTAGRTVLYSSLTVAGALACLLVFPLRFLYSMGIGGSLVALADGAVALIALPALLVALGPRIDALAPARLQRSAARAARADEQGAWFRLARAVMRRPGVVALVTAALLLAAASPSLRLALAPADAHVLPSSSQSRQVAEALTRDFPVDASQAITLVIRAPGPPRAAVRTTPGATSRAIPASVAAIWTRATQAAGAQARAAGPPRYLGHGVWELELQPRGTDGSPANQRLVRRLRAVAPPPRLLVGGGTAWFVDQKAAISAHLPLSLTILALATIGFLFLMTGSLLLPLIALAMNLLTIAVGAGLLVLIFQDGHLGGLFGFAPIGGLEESNLVLLFVVAFALSTDYGVFMFGRIKEAHDGGLTTRESVAHGLERMGRLITAAALLLCVAVGAFVTSHIFFIKQFGLGTALAVAIDASIVRALLVPALMGRLGELTWWAPSPLRRLHARIGLGEREAIVASERATV